MLTYTIPNSGLPVPIKIKADVGFAILIKELPACVFGQDEILCNQLIDMDQHSMLSFMASSLDILSSNLKIDQFVNLKKYYSNTIVVISSVFCGERVYIHTIMLTA